MTKTVILCDCLGTQTIDREAIERGSGLVCSWVHSALCTDQIEQASAAISQGGAIIACQQEKARFEALATELEIDPPAFVDIRDRAGWTADPAPAAAKMAALVAEAALPVAAAKTVDVISEGVCLIIGPADVAVPAAQDLCEALAVTVLLTEGEVPGIDARFDVVKGTVRSAAGALAGFSVRIDALQQVIPGGRGAPQMTEPRDGGSSVCDIIVDLSGAPSLFAAGHKREGYLRADPKSLPTRSAALLEAVQLVGTFEKPLYVRLEPSLCAHSRAEKPACSNCLNLCPTGAITPAGEHVSVDPMICAGCGACSAVCPSGAISYDAPAVETVFRRITTLASTYRAIEGGAPSLLVHDAEHGAEIIRLSARYSDGLPADVIPLEVDALAGFGHAEMLGALAAGFARVDVLLSPKTERDAPVREEALATAIAGAGKIRLLDLVDPEELTVQFAAAPSQAPVAPVLPLGTRRQITRLSAKALAPAAEVIDLPADAPYGAVLVDTGACTLCLSCVSLCPSGALGDNPDLPQLRFQEDACLQCGLCANICPENAITLKPRLNLADAALSQVVLHEEEPFACVECGTLFGTRSTVEKIMEKLAGNHAMFANPQAARMIQMCDNCRIQAQYHSEDNPFASGERPKVRTTDDYLSKRKDH
ncbi:MAG: 4Fe-4S binding protein [Alphaproteobacteria bacterium]|nr:4Fe-4S binding protein [Alphaproteobacteria bacterium]NNF24934.1 4Fe-4S binding protein [Paracoccaceae bacterium]